LEKFKFPQLHSRSLNSQHVKALKVEQTVSVSRAYTNNLSKSSINITDPFVDKNSQNRVENFDRQQ
jgi:hypothetical protein